MKPLYRRRQLAALATLVLLASLGVVLRAVVRTSPKKMPRRSAAERGDR